MDKNKKYIAGRIEQKDVSDDGTIIGVASSEDKDRDGDVIKVDGWELKNFKKNPVLLWSHRQDFPIGKVLDIWKEGKKLMFKAKMYLKDEMGMKVYNFLKDGMLNTVSVGFMPKEFDDGKFTKQELFELSVVPVPSNPEAMVTAVKEFGLGFDFIKSIKKETPNINTIKGAIPWSIHNATPKAPLETEWDGGGEVRKADVKKLKKMSTWFDSENSDVKSAFKLPHHKADDQLTLIWRGVIAAMAALLGARGGLDIPDGDRKSVYNHLKKHYDEFEKEVPDFRYIEVQIMKQATDKELKDFLIQHNEFVQIVLDSKNKTLSMVKKLNTQGTEATHTSAGTRPKKEDISVIQELAGDIKAISRIANKAARIANKRFKKK